MQSLAAHTQVRPAQARDRGSVWDVASGKEQVKLRGSYGRLAFSPDGQRLATASQGSLIKLWDANSHPEARLLCHDERYSRSLRTAWSPDSELVFVAGMGWNVSSPKPLGGIRWVWGAASFKPETGREVFRLPVNVESPFSFCVDGSFSPRGDRFAILAVDGKGKDGEDKYVVRIYDSNTQEMLSSFRRVPPGGGFATRPREKQPLSLRASAAIPRFRATAGDWRRSTISARSGSGTRRPAKGWPRSAVTARADARALRSAPTVAEWPWRASRAWWFMLLIPEKDEKSSDRRAARWLRSHRMAGPWQRAVRRASSRYGIRRHARKHSRSTATAVRSVTCPLARTAASCLRWRRRKRQALGSGGSRAINHGLLYELVTGTTPIERKRFTAASPSAQ